MSALKSIKNNPASFDVAIVGGGMVGITLALLIANRRTDWRIALIESHPIKISDKPLPPNLHNSFDNRSTALAEGSRPILEACGVWPMLQGSLTRINQVHVSDRGHFSGSLLKAEDYQQDALGYVIENPSLGNALGRVLHQQKQIEVLAPAKVNTLKPTESGWQLCLQTEDEESQLDCSLLVLADGTASTLGQKVGIQYTRENYAQSAVIANLETNQAHQGVAYERFTDNGPVALLPLGLADNSCRSALVWTRPADQVEALMALNDQDFCQQLQQAFGCRAGLFQRVSQRHCYPLQLVVAKEQVRRGLVMMGNAAHFLHPVAGQGFNLALRDCQTLVDVIQSANNPGDLSALQSYLHGQQQDQRLTIGLSHNLVKLFSTSALPSALVRSLGLIGMDAISPAKHLFAQQAMGFPLPALVNQGGQP